MPNLTLNNVAPKNTADAHYANQSNPHAVTKSQVGLSNVDNTSDANKPVSTAQQTALDLKQSISTLATNVLAIVLTGFVAGANTAIAATDTLAQALAKIQGQINARPNEDATSIAAINHGAAPKTTLVDADEITGQDSAASFTLIRTTWTNVKAFLKTYFDTLYATSAALDNKIYVVHFNGTFFSPADSTTYMHGGLFTLAPVGSSGGTGRRFNVPYTGTLIGASINILVGGVLGSAENVSIYARINNATDVALITTSQWNGTFVRHNITGLSHAVSADTDYFEIKIVAPAWATNPTDVYIVGTLNIRP